MDITILIDLLPDSVKTDVVDFNDVLLKIERMLFAY